MRPKAYPLEAVRVLRNQAQDAAATELALARARLTDAESAHERLVQAAAQSLEQRVKCLDSAAISGAELIRAGAWAGRLQREHARRQVELERSAAELRRCNRTLRLAELKLHQAYIEREVIERHHARFAEAARKKAERAAEAELDDLVPHLRQRQF